MANYAIMRIEKRKLGSVGRIGNHHERLKAEYKSNPDIDPSRTHQNYHIVDPPSKYRKAVLDRIEAVGAKRRKDSVVMQDCFVGGTPDWLKGKTVEEQRKYFDYAYRFFEDSFGKENIISAVVHLDEATPHMHLCFVPITKKGRLSSKEIIGGPKGLVNWQDKFYAYMHEKYPDITRGTPARLTHRKHIPPFMFKVAGELYDHYGEICGAINDIGLLNNAKKKDAAIALIGRYAPEMAQLKVQLQSTDKHIAYLERELDSERDIVSGYRSRNYAQEQELKEANRKALENREEYHRSTLLDWFTSRESIFSSMNRTDTDGDCRSLVREITICVSEQSQKLSELRKEITAYTGNFSEDNVFAFKTSFSDDKEYMDFACDLKEFIDEDKVSEYQSRINTRNSDIFRQITSDTKSMVSQEGNIRGVVDQINADFKEKNFVGIIQCIEMRIDPSQNKIVNLLKEIKRFNEEYSWDLGQNLFASSADDTAIREKATTLLRELIKSMDAYSGSLIRLADFFDLKFRVIENRNDTGFVERLTNVGSEGTDILVKSMVNIMLLNVFKRNASTVFSDFRLHCMMDEIGKLHPNNVAGILKFANDRDILLINGSPTEQDALSYKHIYKLEKDGDSFTRIRRVITQFD